MARVQAKRAAKTGRPEIKFSVLSIPVGIPPNIGIHAFDTTRGTVGDIGLFIIGGMAVQKTNDSTLAVTRGKIIEARRRVGAAIPAAFQSRTESGIKYKNLSGG